MTTILFVDDKLKDEKRRYRELDFGKKYHEETEYISSPVGLARKVRSNSDLRLVILDVLWSIDGRSMPLGAEAMRELFDKTPDVPVVIHSVIDQDALLHALVPEMMRLGAFDWVDKAESKMLRSFRFQRAYDLGRDVSKLPAGRAILANDQQSRGNVYLATMFVDMSGFTFLTEEIGAQAVSDILEEFYELVAAEVIRYGGYVDKYIGDAVMAVFGAGMETEKDESIYARHAIEVARSLVRKASVFQLDVVEKRLKQAQNREKIGSGKNAGLFRAGVESGLVEIRRFKRGNESEVTFVGRSVNIASRLLNHAEAGEVWIGVNAYGNGGSNLTCEMRRVEHKNLAGEFPAYVTK